MTGHNFIPRTVVRWATRLGPALLVLLAAGLPAASAAPRSTPAAVNRYVVPSGNDASPDCSLAQPCQTVQRAVAVAQPGDDVLVAAGAYTSTMFAAGLDQGVTATVIVSKAIAALRGGYSADFSAHDPAAHPTSLSASGAPGAYVLVLDGVNTLVDGFTLSGSTGACSPGCGTHYFGGGVRIHGGAPTLSHNHITGNFAYTRGGGIYTADGANATITANLIDGNTVDGNGGGIYVQGSNALIAGNQILSNVAVVEGGGIYVDVNVPAVIRDNAIGYNQATNPVASRGAGVRTVGGDAVDIINHNDVFSNSLAWGGGAGLDLSAPALVDRNSIHHNTLHIGGWGGALILAGVTRPVTVTNNLVYANHGSGVQSVNSTLVAFVNNTVADNVHVQPDSGTEADAYLIWFDGPPAGPVALTVYNNILSDNANCGLFYHNAPPGITSAHNDSWNNHANAANYCEQAVPGPGDLSANPLFTNPAAADYHLLDGSPAVDSGASPLAPDHDRDCVSRPRGAGFDLGAYEQLANRLSAHLGQPLQVFLPLVQVALPPVC